MIRVGGQSRSPELDDINLRAVSRAFVRKKHESTMLSEAYSELRELMETARNTLGLLSDIQKGAKQVSTALRPFLSRRYPRVYSQLYPPEGEVSTSTTPRDALLALAELGNKYPAVDPEEFIYRDEISGELLRRAELDMESLTPLERQFLWQTWVKQFEREQTERLAHQMSLADALQDRINTIHTELNHQAILSTDVIGITTTGLAKEASLLQRLRCKVILCEEAAEILEAHLISALMPGVEHIIQIGDHQQLRPQINNHRDLSLESRYGKPYQLDRSQFERLAVGQVCLPPIPIAQLNVQRRMRPVISQFIRGIYPRLEDHYAVRNLDNVVGMRKNLFWLDHQKIEDESNHTGHRKSFSNSWEVEMAKALVRHLVRQGVYRSTDLAILTPYTGQLQKLRVALSQDFEFFSRERNVPPPKTKLIDSIRLATVDNFQGEEAKVIILSLVRSNRRQKVGFLKTINRINVAVSRAQHGMYLIGNADTYRGVPMWADIVRQFERAKSIGKAFDLCCSRHVTTPIRCAEPVDFVRYSPEGGCLLGCDKKLERCGHRCPSKCHSDAMHRAFTCVQPCPRFRSTCHHQCPKLCGEECGPCVVLLGNIQLPCGHYKDGIPCHQTQTATEIQCHVLVKKNIQSCSHVQMVKCFTDVGSDLYLCPTECQGVLGCGHRCPGSCGGCQRGGVALHQSCNRGSCRSRNTYSSSVFSV